MIALSAEEREQLGRGKAVNVTDSDTAEEYVLLRKDVYDRVRRLLYDASDWTDEEMRASLARSAKENGWDEPGMDAYDRYDEEVTKRCP